jgi:hypothetical protein
VESPSAESTAVKAAAVETTATPMKTTAVAATMPTATMPTATVPATPVSTAAAVGVDVRVQRRGEHSRGHQAAAKPRFAKHDVSLP